MYSAGGKANVYILYIRTICQLPLSLFVDDVMYHYGSMSPRYASVVLQCQLAVLPECLRKWRVTINSEKSETICFTYMSTSNCPIVSLEERPISWEKSVKYLVTGFDRT